MICGAEAERRKAARKRSNSSAAAARRRFERSPSGGLSCVLLGVGRDCSAFRQHACARSG